MITDTKIFDKDMVIAKKIEETPEQFEARMIAQFNQKVNQTDSKDNDVSEKSHVSELSDSFESKASSRVKEAAKPNEHNGPKGLEPTRYGDWEAKGRCHDF